MIMAGLLVGIVAGLGGWFLGSKRGAIKGGGLSPAALEKALKDNRLELNIGLKQTTDSLNQQFSSLQTVLSSNLKDLRHDNHQQLDRMRQTVDEKLQATLEKRLTQTFQVVNHQLEAVHHSMGEMKSLATDVGKLQKTLTGVKTRGVWGEAHLGNLLAEVLNSEQYATNFKPNPKQRGEVEFALKIPADNDTFLYIPVDAKFPLTPFESLQAALTDNQPQAIMRARKTLTAEIKKQAKEIGKYIQPPLTTDFAIMYLPLESLYAEVSQNTALIEDLRQSYKITVVGPNTILPMLSMLNMSYRSLAMQKHVSEAWQILLETQAEFAKFGALLGKAQAKLKEATDVIELADTKTRTIEAKFKKVQRLDHSAGSQLLEDDLGF